MCIPCTNEEDGNDGASRPDCISETTRKSKEMGVRTRGMDDRDGKTSSLELKLNGLNHKLYMIWRSNGDARALVLLACRSGASSCSTALSRQL